MYTCMYVYIYIYIHVRYVYIYIYMYVSLSLYIYIYIHYHHYCRHPRSWLVFGNRCAALPGLSGLSKLYFP